MLSTMTRWLTLALCLFVGGLLCLDPPAQALPPNVRAVILQKQAGVGAVSTVLVDAVGTAGTSGSGTSFNYSTFTMGAVSNGALLAFINSDSVAGNAEVGMTAVWDSGGTNQAMTLLISSPPLGNRITQIWGLRAPTAGNKTLAVSWTNATRDFQIDVISFSNVNQTSNGAAFPHTASGNSVTTTTITSAAGNKVVSALSYTGSLAANIRGTVIYKDIAVVAYRSAAAYDVGAGSVTIGQDNVNGNLAGVDVKAF